MTVTITRVRPVDLPSEIWTFGPPAPDVPDVPDVSLPGALAVTTRVEQRLVSAGAIVCVSTTVAVRPIGGVKFRPKIAGFFAERAGIPLLHDALRHLKL